MKPDEIFVVLLVVACVAILFAMRRHSKRMEAALEVSAELPPVQAELEPPAPQQDRPRKKRKSRV